MRDRSDNRVVVYKRVIARKLVYEGYIIIDIQDNPKIKGQPIFYFKDEPSIRDRIKELSKWKGDSKEKT